MVKLMVFDAKILQKFQMFTNYDAKLVKIFHLTKLFAFNFVFISKNSVEYEN
jgi:hypothetical protein